MILTFSSRIQMDQLPPPGPSNLYNIRLSSLLTFLFVVDAFALRGSWEGVKGMMDGSGRGGGAGLLFASEVSITLSLICGEPIESSKDEVKADTR